MRQKIKKSVQYIPVIFVLILGLNPIIWFYKKPNILISGSDTNFPLDPVTWFQRRLYMWNTSANAGSDFSSSGAGLFFHLLQVIPYKLGFGLQQVELITFIFWFSAIIISAYLLARKFFPGDSWSHILSTVLYSYNTYLFNTWENAKVTNLSLVAAIPLGLLSLSTLNDISESKSKAVLLLVITAIILSGSGINPAYFLIFFLVLFIYLISDIISNLKSRQIISKLINFGFACLLILFVNSYWIIPSASYILKSVGPSASLEKIGYTNWVDSLSTHTSLLNILRLQGAWDWYSFDSITNVPTYIPYALNYFYRLPFILFSFIVPTLAIIALVVKKSKNSTLPVFFALLLILGVFMGSGTHPPTGAIFKFFSEHVPFFSLFRSPWYIFTPLVLVAYSGLVSLLFFNLKGRGWIVSVGALIIVGGNLIYTYPLGTGKIFRPSQLDNFLIKFPQYVFDSGKWLSHNSLVSSTRIISYPPDEIERFKWGYNGIDSILGVVSSANVLFPTLNALDSPTSQILREIYQNLYRGKTENVINLASKMNSSLIIDKEDQSSLSPSLPESIKKSVEAKFGLWTFYKLSNESILKGKIFIPKRAYFGYPPSMAVHMLEAISDDSVLLNPGDSVINKVNNISNHFGSVIMARNSQSEDLTAFSDSPHILSTRLVDRNLSYVDYYFDAPNLGEYQPLLDRYKVEDFGLNTSSLAVILDGTKTSWIVTSVTDSQIVFSPISLKKGAHVARVILENRDYIDGGDFENGMKFRKIGEGIFSINSSGDNNFLTIFNKYGKSAPDPTARFAMRDFDPLAVYLFKIKYRQIYGSMGSLAVQQMSDRTAYKSIQEGLPNYPEWGIFTTYYTPVQTKSDMTVDLISPFISDALGTKVEYDDLHAYKVFTNKLLFVKQGDELGSMPNVTFKEVSPVSYSGKVTNSSGPHVLTFLENYSPQWTLRIYGKNHQRLSVKPEHFSVNSYANAWYVDVPADRYEFEIYYLPQDLHNFGLIISGLTVLFATMIICLKR